MRETLKWFYEGGNGGVACIFFFSFTLCIGEAGPAQDTTAFGVFPFPYLHLHHRRKASSTHQRK